MSDDNSSSIDEGNIYIVTSPLVNAIKIGKTMHDFKYLKTRYATTFGSTMTIFKFWSNDISTHEHAVHDRLAEHNICLELFHPKCLVEAICVCENICNATAIRADFQYRKCKKSINSKKQLQKITQHVTQDLALNTIPNDKILIAPDINEETYVATMEKVDKMDADCAAIWRYQLRCGYRFRGEITAEFLTAYNSVREMEIYANLSAILAHPTWQESLELIRECDVLDGDPLQCKYMRHALSMMLITSCGFDDILDAKLLSRVAITTALDTNKAAIMAAQDDIHLAFKGAPKLDPKADFKATLKFINGKISVMYGYHIGALTRANKDRNTFKIHRNSPNKQELFPMVIDAIKPYIIRGQIQEPVIINE